ncbi:BnaC06g12230D [Brassica napus]|uniref:(rape) hypothetical protein n=1 Tax=Brassica napus TaxID=3708 RepID=A0A078GP94_BRANA|nr:unnamed protein product [Brassica napus]CDY27007.1 BnaC06g12230D [Brassica napus]
MILDIYLFETISIRSTKLNHLCKDDSDVDDEGGVDDGDNDIDNIDNGNGNTDNIDDGDSNIDDVDNGDGKTDNIDNRNSDIDDNDNGNGNHVNVDNKQTLTHLLLVALLLCFLDLMFYLCAIPWEEELIWDGNSTLFISTSTRPTMRIIPENNWNHRYKLLAKEHNIALPPKEDDQTTTERRRPETDP